MSKIMTEIPGSFPTVLSDAMASDVDHALADFKQSEDPGIIAKYEREFTNKLKAANPGDDFLGQKVTRVDPAADTATVQARISGRDVPFVPGLKIGLASAELEIARKINLTDIARDRLPIEVKRMVSFAIELELTKKDNYEVRIGYAQDDSATNQSQMALVSVKWDNPKFSLFGLLGKTDKGGLLIDVKGESPFAIPLGATGFGLKGIGLLYGEHFAPLLKGAVPGNAMQRLASADAGAYADWAQSAKSLETWIAVPEDINVFGVSAVLADMGTGGGLVRIQELGLAYLSYGPTLIFSGEARLLEMIDGGSTIGVIDLRSRSFFARNTQRYDVIPWAKGAMVAEGSLEFSASLTNQDRTYLAIGGYGMDGCRIKLLDFLELSGGVRLVPTQGIAARARGNISAEGTICGFGGGYRLWFDVQGGLGWNPATLESKLEIGGSIWIEALGKRLGLGASLSTELYLKKPLIFRMNVDFEVSFWFVTVHIPVKIFDYHEPEPATPEPTLKRAAGAPLATMHPPSGQVGELNPARPSIWPDTMFVLDFQRSAGGSDIVVNPVSGYVREAGVDVQHRFSMLAVERQDPVTGGWTAVTEVRASWLLNSTEGATRPSSRLAIPCNDPIGWVQRFDYAQPPTSARVETVRLQTFGLGQTRIFLPTAGAPALARFEDVEITARRQFCLIAVPWADGYVRALSIQQFEISFSAPDAAGSRAPIPVIACELRVLAPLESPPQLSVHNGHATGPRLLRVMGANQGEWTIEIERRPTEALLPVLINSEWPNLVAAIGYRVDETVESQVPDTHVMAPGHYRLMVRGDSSASFRGTAAPGASAWAVEREFDVEPPPLRPYLRYATLGDERVFGIQAGGWNPNPAGQGFGHYPDHLGQIRSSVAYLNKIYPSLFVRTDDASADVLVAVSDCQQGTLAGGKSVEEWRVETGQPIAIEDELSFEVGQPVGFHQIAVRRSDTDGASVGNIVDQWSYRVSRFTSPSAHLSTVPGLSRAIGPWGSREVHANAGPAIPTAFDIDSVPAATLGAGWTLPKPVASLAGVEHPDASLSFLRLLEWCGVNDAPPAPMAEGPWHRPEVSDLCLVSDRGTAPVALLMRTPEPCDWRRVGIIAVTSYADAAARRFTVRSLPSPDGCQCILVLEAEGVPVRVPKGDMLLRIRFSLEVAPLPRLTLRSNPAQTFEEVVTTLKLPVGMIWWEA